MNFVNRITILLAENHKIVRTELRRLLERESDIEVLDEASTGWQALELSKLLHPSIVIMDIAMPLLNGLDATRQILQALPDTKILILSAHNDDAYIDRAMESGAAGYLIKQTSAHTLIEAVRMIQRGNVFLSHAIGKHFPNGNRKSFDRQGRAKKKDMLLTSREAEVLQLIAEGKPNKQIAAELGILGKTVEKHRDNLMRKLHIHGTASLTRHAIAKGIVDCGVQLTIVPLLPCK